MVDFDEQIYRAIEVLLTDPAVREQARLACRVMLVDEFQDLTPAHVLLVRLLSGPAGSVFGVGDDDQTIYGYAGASPGWLIDYQTYFPGAGSHLLEVNYRCPPPSDRGRPTLLTHNRTRVPKVIVSPLAVTERATDAARGLATEVSEDPVAATVERFAPTSSPGSILRRLAILARVNSSLAPVQLSLQNAGIAGEPGGGCPVPGANRCQGGHRLAQPRHQPGPAAFVRGQLHRQEAPAGDVAEGDRVDVGAAFGGAPAHPGRASGGTGMPSK